MATTSSKPKQQPDLSIVVPAYREEKRIGATLDELAEYIRTQAFLKPLVVEVIVVSADSPDKTHEIIRSKQKLFKNFQFVTPGPKLGKGRDVRAGMLKARGKIVIYMDADLATPLHHLEKFYDACKKGSDVVIGTRNLLKHHHSKFRTMISNGGNLLFRVAGGVWVEDSQCGFKMFNEHANKLCFSKMTILLWGFDMEVLAIANANGLKIKSFRISDWKDMPDSTFTGNMVQNSLNSLKDLAHIVRNRLCGVYLEK